MAKLSIHDLLTQATTKVYMSDLPVGRYTAKFCGLHEIEEDKLQNIRPSLWLKFTVQYNGQTVECTDFLTYQDIDEVKQIENFSKKYTIIQRAVFGSVDMQPAEVQKKLFKTDVNIWITKRLDDNGIVRTNLQYYEPIESQARAIME